MGGIVPYGKERLDRVEIAIFPKNCRLCRNQRDSERILYPDAGRRYDFALSQCEKECVYAEGKKIRICCKSPEDQAHVKQLFEAWWRRQAKEILQERVHVWYPIVEKYGVAMPELSIRKMKTLWGSCSVARHVITFNFYLIKARTPYIDYVVLHELVHFLYPNHSKQFYAFLSNYMPDWKERKLVLDQEVVHEL